MDSKQHKNEHEHHGPGHSAEAHVGAPEPKAASTPGVGTSSAPAAAAAPAAGQAPAPKPAEKPRDPADALREELKALQDKYLRVLAEFDNYKRRTLRERQQLVESANAGLMLDLTEVRESFERALKAGAGSTSAGPVLEGMRLIYAKLDDVLGRHGLEPYAGQGEQFDPELHDAMMRVPDPAVAEGHVAQVVECGYRLKGQVLKHARVVVSAGAPQQPAAQEQPAPSGEHKE